MNNRNCWHDRSCKLCKGRKIDLYSASWEQWDVWASPHLTAAWLAATVANAEWMQPLSRILARGHAARVSNRKNSLAKVWHPIARIGEKTEFEAFALDTVSQLCVSRRRSQWYESGYSSGVGCVPGCVHAYPSSRGSIHESCQPPAPPAHNMQFLQLGSSPLLLHVFCSRTLHYYSCNIIFIWQVWFPGELTPDQDQEVWVGRS